MKHSLAIICAVLCSSGVAVLAAEERPAKPNFVVIYADDVGG